MARFKKGQRGNPDGKKRGTANRTTEQMQGLIQSFVEDNWQKVQKDFNAMKPAERLSFLNSLLKLVLPPPIVPEQLSEHQLQQLLEFVQKRYDEQN